MSSEPSKGAPVGGRATPQFAQTGLNYFQLVAFQLNIRQTVGVHFPATPVSNVAALWYQTVAKHGAHVQIALARMPHDPTKTRPMIARQQLDVNGPQTKNVSFPPPSIRAMEGLSMEELLERCLYLNFPNTGMPAVILFIEGSTAAKSQDAPCASLIVNFNAALWDTTTTHTVVNAFLYHLARMHDPESIIPPPAEKDPQQFYCRMQGLMPVMLKKIQELATDNQGQLPGTQPVSPDQEAPSPTPIDIILPKPSNTNPQLAATPYRRVVAQVDGETVLACERQIQAFAAAHGGLTSTLISLRSFATACFLRALAMEYFEEVAPFKKRVTIVQSTQIDPRELIFPKGFHEPYLHAVGTLSHGLSYNRMGNQGGGERSGDEQGPSTDNRESLVECLLRESLRVEQDLQQRLKRGEGLQKTMELMTGRMDQQSTTARVKPVAIELMDHGVYECLHPDFEISVGHRMDSCPHMSIAMFRKKPSHQMTWAAQIGKNQGREATMKWMERSRAMWSIVASAEDLPSVNLEDTNQNAATVFN